MISDDRKIKNIELVQKLIGEFDVVRRKTVTQMMDVIGEEYFVAPASSRADFHNAFPGGLCDHSLRVVKYLIRLQKDLAPDRWGKNMLVFVGLFHDLGKVGVDGVPRYLPNPDGWQRSKWGKLYTINEKMPFMTLDDATCYTLQKHNVEVTHEEFLALRLADGQYDPSNKAYAMKEPDLGLLVHWADMWSSNEEKASAENQPSM